MGEEVEEERKERVRKERGVREGQVLIQKMMKLPRFASSSTCCYVLSSGEKDPISVQVGDLLTVMTLSGEYPDVVATAASKEVNYQH